MSAGNSTRDDSNAILLVPPCRCCPCYVSSPPQHTRWFIDCERSYLRLSRIYTQKKNYNVDPF